MTPRDVKTKTLCLFLLSGSLAGGGFVPVFDTDLYTGTISTFNSKVWGFSVSGFVPLPQRLAGISRLGKMTGFQVDLIVGYRECEIIGGEPIVPCVFSSVGLRIRAGRRQYLTGRPGQNRIPASVRTTARDRRWGPSVIRRCKFRGNAG